MPTPLLRVFIADDSPPVAEMLTEFVSRPGRVEVVGIGETEEGSIESIRRIRPDVVLLDLQLRGGSGTNVIRAVRADDSLAGTRLVVTSNHTSPQLKAGCLELGANGYFDKVKELMQLDALLGELAEQKQREA